MYSDRIVKLQEVRIFYFDVPKYFCDVVWHKAGFMHELMTNRINIQVRTLK